MSGPLEGLPAGLAPPLHIDEPFDWSSLVGPLLLVLLLLAWWLYRRWRKRIRPTAAAPVVRRQPQPFGVEAAVHQLLGRYVREPRRGCHELAQLMRGHLESVRPRRFTTLTTPEIRGALGDTAVSRFFELLADLQFGRRPPTSGDFSGACDLAIEVARSGDKRS